MGGTNDKVRGNPINLPSCKLAVVTCSHHRTNDETGRVFGEQGYLVGKKVSR